MKKGNVAVVGDCDEILIFNAIGASIYNAITPQDAEKVIRKIARDYTIIYISDTLAVKMGEYLERFENRSYPIIVPIPTAGGSNGYAIDRIRKNVEKAIGLDILDDEE